MSGKTVPIPAYSWIKDYQQKKEYTYVEAPTHTAQTPWDIFVRWFWQQIDKLFSSEAAETFWRYFLYIFGAAALVALVWYFNKFGKGILQKDPAKRMMTGVLTEDIHEINFEAVIAEAERQQNYKWAIRWQYLKYLKYLDEEGIIDWQVFKTNSDYKWEINNSLERSKFTRIAFIYEDTWYGDHTIDEPTYRQYITLINNPILTLAD